ncbi:MAG: hypothetical protein ACI35O_10025, partial [Bacillaceae bacterium]
MCCECTKKRRSSCPEESNVTIDNGLSAIPNITRILCSSQAAPVEEKPCHTCHHDKAKNKKHEKENDWVFHHEHHKKEDDWDHEHHEKDDDCDCDHDHH